MIYNSKTVSEFKNDSKDLKTFYVLLLKDWDMLSNILRDFVEDNFSTHPSMHFFLLDLFEDPTFFEMYQTTTAPALIVVNENGARDQTIPGMIWKTLESLASQ